MAAGNAPLFSDTDGDGFWHDKSLTKVMRRRTVDEAKLLDRITVDLTIFGGKPTIRGRRLAVEHVLAMLAADDQAEDILKAYPWLEADDIRACLTYAHRMVAHERVEPSVIEKAA